MTFYVHRLVKSKTCTPFDVERFGQATMISAPKRMGKKISGFPEEVLHLVNARSYLRAQTGETVFEFTLDVLGIPIEEAENLFDDPMFVPL